MELFSHPLYTFTYDPELGVITFRWTPDTEGMSVHDYKEALHNFAGFAFDNPARGLLVDIREFRFRSVSDLGTWRDDVIAPRYVKAGVKRFAYVASPGVIERMKGSMRERKRGFEEDYFNTEEQALRWLST